MPLLKGTGKKVISKNISECMHKGKPQNQCVAMSLTSAGKKGKKNESKRKKSS